jgi:hypothetical protein
MKKVTITLVILLIFSISAYAETGMQGSQQGQMGQGMMMEQGQQMPMNCPKMQQMHGQEMMQGGQQMPMAQMGPMMGQGMIMQEMMQMMMDVMNMQEQIINGVKASEKKMMLEKIKDMKARMQNKMTMCNCMMGSMMGSMMGPMMRGGMSGHDMMPPHSEFGSKETEKEAPEKQKEAPAKTDPHGH